MAKTSLDHAAVEELERVLGTETQRVLRVRKRLGAPPVPYQRPREHVVAVDRGPVAPADPGKRERMAKADPVVGVEEGDLQVGLDAVGAEQPLDRADQGVLTPREQRVTRDAVEIPERTDVLRQRDQVDGLALERDRP